MPRTSTLLYINNVSTRLLLVLRLELFPAYMYFSGRLQSVVFILRDHVSN